MQNLGNRVALQDVNTSPARNAKRLRTALLDHAVQVNATGFFAIR
jgi:hypothetical protein